MGQGNYRFGSSAALCALIIQLVLSFGHMHPDTHSGHSAATAAQLQTSDASGTTPTDNHHDGDGDDFCAICAALNLTSSSVLPTISLLTAPIDSAARGGSPTIVPRKFHLSCVFISRHARLLTPI